MRRLALLLLLLLLPAGVVLLDRALPPDLTRLHGAQLRWQLNESRRRLQKTFGVRVSALGDTAG